MARRNRKRNRSAAAKPARSKPDADAVRPPTSDCVAVLVAPEDAAETIETSGTTDTTETIDTAVVPDAAVNEVGHNSVMAAIAANADLLQQLIGRIDGLQPRESIPPADPSPFSDERIGDATRPTNDRRDQEIAALTFQVDELTQQNHELASRIADDSVRETVASNGESRETLSWDERKAIILQQMNDDSFDADAFVSELTPDVASEKSDPVTMLRDLVENLRRRDEEIDRQRDELRELRGLLQHQSETREGGVAIGAAAIAGMIDQDELVRNERERLTELQAEWEDKFRQSEIEASLERAKLSRERQEVARKINELDEQLEHIRREDQVNQETGSSGTSRRWLAKLGLADD